MGNELRLELTRKEQIVLLKTLRGGSVKNIAKMLGASSTSVRRTKQEVIEKVAAADDL